MCVLFCMTVLLTCSPWRGGGWVLLSEIFTKISVDLPLSPWSQLSARTLCFFLTQKVWPAFPPQHTCAWAADCGWRRRVTLAQAFWSTRMAAAPKQPLRITSHPSVFPDLTPSFQKYLHIFSCLTKPPASPPHSSWSTDDFHASLRKWQQRTRSHPRRQSHAPVRMRTSLPPELRTCAHAYSDFRPPPPREKHALPCSLFPLGSPVSTWESSLLTLSPLSGIFKCPLSTGSFLSRSYRAVLSPQWGPHFHTWGRIVSSFVTFLYVFLSFLLNTYLPPHAGNRLRLVFFTSHWLHLLSLSAISSPNSPVLFPIHGDPTASRLRLKYPHQSLQPWPLH